MDKAKIKILLAEDDLNLGVLLLDFLQTEGFEVKLCKDGELALKAFLAGSFDLCLLDVMMPKMDGFTLAKEIRLRNKNVPVLFLTAKSQRKDKQEAYDSGADDFIIKPFDEEELLWKIKAIIRRIPEAVVEKEPELIILGKYTFDHQNQCLTIGDKKKRITEKESELLRYLYNNRNKVVKREDILKDIWGENDYFLGRSLDVFITKIRKYLSEDPDIGIENVFGVGFILNTGSN